MPRLAPPSGPQVAAALGVAVAGIALASVPLTIAGAWAPQWAALAAAAAVLAAVPALRRMPAQPWTSARATVWLALSAVAAVGLRNPSEHVATDRDPAIYYLKATLLLETGGTTAPAVPEPFAGSPSVAPVSPGEYPIAGSGEFLTQFLNGPGALQALGLAVWPVVGAMAVSVLLAWLASVALFELAAPLAGTVVAGGASLAAALSLPWVYFGRGTYSEPPAAALLLTGLLVLAAAVRSRSVLLGGLAGVLLGSVFLVRIDAALAVGPVLLGCALVAARSRGGRRVTLAVVAATALTSAVWLADGYYLTPGYVRGHRDEIELATVFLVACGGVAVLALLAGRLLGTGPRGQRVWWGVETTAAVGVVVAAVALAALWFLAPVLLPGSGEEVVGPGRVAALQERESLPDDLHDYSEWLGQRLAWAVGAPLMVAAIVGLAGAARRLVTRPESAPIVLAAVATAVGYATVSSITPDMPWALRRLMPAVIPAAAIAAAVAIAVLLPRRRGLRLGAAGLLVLGAAGASLPVVTESERGGTLDAMGEVCDALPEDAAVYVADGTIGQWNRPLTFRCDVPTARGTPGIPYEEVLALAAEAEEAGLELVLVADRGDVLEGAPGVEARLVTSYDRRTIEQTLARRPQYVVLAEREVWLYTVDPDAPGVSAAVAAP